MKIQQKQVYSEYTTRKEQEPANDNAQTLLQQPNAPLQQKIQLAVVRAALTVVGFAIIGADQLGRIIGGRKK